MDMDLINESCILCFSSNENTISIFSAHGQELNIVRILTNHFWFQIDESSSEYPKAICLPCWHKTESFHTFYKSVEVAHNHFLTTKVLVKTENDSLTEQCSAYAISIPQLTTNSRENKTDECFSELDGTDNDVNMQNETATNLTDYFDENDDDYDDDNDVERIEFEVDPDIVLGKSKSKSGHRKSTKSKTRKKRNYERNYLNQCEDGDGKLNAPMLQEMEQKVHEFFDMTCDLCTDRFASLAEAKDHYQLRHDIPKGYLKCCGKKFHLPGRVLDHVNWHLNPKAFSCKVCSKSFTEKRALAGHVLRHVDEESRQYVCEHCNKRFTKRHKLKKHVLDVHPIGNQKHTCEFCDKSFKSDTILKGHILKIHRRAYEQMCDICAKIFNTKEGFQDHMQSHMNVGESRVQCTFCGAWLKNRGSLNKHVKLHTDKPEVCSICKAIKPNRTSLNRHMRSVHSEATHHCTICDKTFKRVLALTEHIASHTGENLYTCPYCIKPFKSNSNLHKHRKIAHFEQWYSDRQKRLAIFNNP